MPQENLPELYEFLGVRNVFNRENVELVENHEPFNTRTEEGLLELLVKLDVDPTEALNDLERLIFEGHLRLSSETIRQLFAGLGNRKGLLQIALT